MLPASAMEVVRILQARSKPMTAQEISSKVKYSPRTVRYALLMLQEREIVKKVPNLHDMRKVRYALTRTLEQVRADILGKNIFGSSYNR